MNQENIFDRERRAIYFELIQTGIEEHECWAEADLILEHVTGIKRTQQITSDLDNFKADWLQEVTRIINSRRQRMPLAYCLGETEFSGLIFKVIPGVLIPRTDTETIVAAVVDRICRGALHTPAYIAEIGVGSGAIAVSLLKLLPDCHVWGCDTSEIAITTTLGNARRHNVHERLTLVHGDWKKIMPNNFNVIVSNPPYLPLSLQENIQPEISFEPKLALFDGSEDGLSFYRQFAEKLPAHFTGAGNAPLQENEIHPFAVFEIGDKQEQDILNIFKQNNWQNLLIHNDTNGLPRALLAFPFSSSPPRG